MFEVGFTEIILILGLALLVLGPEKLPGLAEKIGRWTGRARSMARQLRTQLEQEVTIEQMAKSKPMHPAPPPETVAPTRFQGSVEPATSAALDPAFSDVDTTPEATPEAMHGKPEKNVEI